MAKFVLDECSSKEEIIALHSEISAMEEAEPEKFQQIFDLALQVLVTSNIGYRAIAALPLDILEFLNSHNFVRYNIKLEDLVAGADVVLDVKRNFVKTCLKPFTQDIAVLSKVDSAKEEELDILLGCENLPQAFRHIELEDIISLDLPILEKLVSELAFMLYAHGVKWQDLVGSGDVVKMKQNILMASVRLAMQEEGHPGEVILEISKAISQFTEIQLDFIDECDCDLIEMVKFAVSHPGADRAAFERRALEVEYGSHQIVEEGLLKDISDEKLGALKSHGADYFVKAGYVSLEVLMQLPPELIPMAVHYNMINTYNFMETDVAALFLSPDPGVALDALKAECLNCMMKAGIKEIPHWQAMMVLFKSNFTPMA